jgi:hypothetical protein
MAVHSGAEFGRVECTVDSLSGLECWYIVKFNVQWIWIRDIVIAGLLLSPTGFPQMGVVFMFLLKL